jgi:N-acetylmuramoyl-L-alanine amidase
MIVLDPGHGGTDSGARGGTGAIEKDIVLLYARFVRGQLERQGFRVALTRNDDSNPSYDDRAAIANAYRDAIFISLHVSTMGAAGTARVYYYRFGSSPAGARAALDTTEAKPAAPRVSLVEWRDAQFPHLDSSHSLADLLQIQLAEHFPGSPTRAAAVPVRELRSVDTPAVAIEISSVSVADPSSLAGFAAPLADSIAHALEAFRSARAGGN